MAQEQLRLGHTVVADSVNPVEATRQAWRAIAVAAAMPYLEVEVVCSDPGEHRRRAELRRIDIPELPAPSWAQILAREYEPWHSQVVVDTATMDTDAAVRRVLAQLAVASHSPVLVRRMPPGHADVVDFLRAHDTHLVARHGELVDATALPALAAFDSTTSGEVAGVLTYDPRGERCEILTLHVARQWAGVGTALMAELFRIAPPTTVLWLVTTNDNVDALRFYQRRGFRLAGVNVGAVDAERASVKPAIPLLGEYGIP